MTAQYAASEEPLVSFIGLPEPSYLDDIPAVNPVQRALHDSCTLEEYEIITPSGIPLRVFVQPSKSKSAIVTYHDIGTNYSSFIGFFSYPEMRVICKHFTVYHVCAPGHHEGASNIAPGDWMDKVVKKIKTVIANKLMECVKAQIQTTLEMQSANRFPRQQPEGQEEALLKTSDRRIGDRSSSIGSVFTVLGRQSAYQNISEPEQNSSKAVTYPTLDELAEMLTSVVDYFKLEYFVGFGMGAGSNIFARFALQHPDKVLALFLLNPNGTTHAYYEWFRNRWSDLPNLQRGVFTDSLLNQLEAHWFGFGLAENEDLIAYYTQLIHSLNPVNVAGYIDAYINRTDLGLVRSLELPSIVEQREKDATGPVVPTAIKVNTCLVTGSLATDLSRALSDLNGRMDPRKTQFLMVPDCTGFLMEENPDKLAVNFLHFLRNEGLVINLTPEKLHKEAAALQVESAVRANAVVPTSAMISDSFS